MSKKTKTYVAIVLDRSGSMHTISEEAVAGYNEHIRKFKENTEEQDVKVSLVTFNSDVFEHYWLENVENVETANQADYNPDGLTAMLDAMGYTIDKLEESTNPNDEDNAYLVITISDGRENASKHVSRSHLASRISALQKTGRWTFTYMGCSASDLEEVARSTGIPLANCAMWSNATKGTANAAYGASASAADKYLKHRVRAAKAGGVARGIHTSSLNFYSDDAAKCADFTAPVGDADPIGPLYVAPPASVSVPRGMDNFARTGKIEVPEANTDGVNVFSSVKKPVTWKS